MEAKKLRKSVVSVQETEQSCVIPMSKDTGVKRAIFQSGMRW